MLSVQLEQALLASLRVMQLQQQRQAPIMQLQQGWQQHALLGSLQVKPVLRAPVQQQQRRRRQQHLAGHTSCGLPRGLLTTEPPAGQTSVQPAAHQQMPVVAAPAVAAASAVAAAPAVLASLRL